MGLGRRRLVRGQATPSLYPHMSEAEKDWKSVLDVYAGHPDNALILAQLMAHLKEHIESGPKGRREALAQLEFAVKILYPHSRFNHVSKETVSPCGRREALN